MSYKFNDEDKAEMSDFPERMPFGVNRVQLVGVTPQTAENGNEFLEITVTNDDGIEENARLYFTDASAPYSFNTIRQVVVHSAKSDADKEKARMAVEKCADTDEVAELLNTKCVGAELWLTKYYDPKRTYIARNGETRRSISTNLYGYEPPIKPELMPKSEDAAGNSDPLEGATPATGAAADNIPGDWS